jgi:hypothetical protein
MLYEDTFDEILGAAMPVFNGLKPGRGEKLYEMQPVE